MTLVKSLLTWSIVSDGNCLCCPAMLDLGPASSDYDNTQMSFNIFEVILRIGNHSTWIQVVVALTVTDSEKTALARSTENASHLHQPELNGQVCTGDSWGSSGCGFYWAPCSLLVVTWFINSASWPLGYGREFMDTNILASWHFLI